MRCIVLRSFPNLGTNCSEVYLLLRPRIYTSLSVFVSEISVLSARIWRIGAFPLLLLDFLGIYRGRLRGWNMLKE